MEFTPKQQAAIDARSCSLLVSAGAGSGKTRVLTERLIARLLDPDDHTDITRFLIVTFTNASAKELIERIRRALTEKIAQTGGSKRLMRSLALLGSAHIYTIDAFCKDFVWDNFQKLGLPPKLSMRAF